MKGTGNEGSFPLRQNSRRVAGARRSRRDRNPQGAVSGERVVRRLCASRARAEHQAGSFAESAPLRLEDSEARHESDADNQRAPVRNQTRSRAVRSDTEAGDRSASPGRDRYTSADQRERVAKAAITRRRTKSSPKSRSFARPAKRSRAIRRISTPPNSAAKEVHWYHLRCLTPHFEAGTKDDWSLPGELSPQAALAYFEKHEGFGGGLELCRDGDLSADFMLEQRTLLRRQHGASQRLTAGDLVRTFFVRHRNHSPNGRADQCHRCTIQSPMKASPN